MNEKKYHILFVDDEENNLIAFRNAFFRQYQITTAASPVQAVEWLREQHVQLIITDQRMPGLSGIEFLRMAREVRPEAVQIIITGYSDLEVIMQAFNELGVFYYALKPWNNYDLKIIIDNALNKYQLTQDNRQLIGQLQAANEALEQKVQARTGELERQTAEYIQLNRLKDKLFSIISHDLRGPLTAVGVFIEIFLKGKGELSEQETYELMTELGQSVVNLQEMLENLLSWSRSQMNQVAMQVSRASLNQSIKKNLSLYGPVAAQKQITLSADLSDADIVVETDENMLNLVIRNLLSNALKFTPSGGSVTVVSSRNDRYASIAVADNGVGIPSETVQKLFSNETVISTYGTAYEKGTGLGLKLTKEFAERQGGMLTVTSEPDKGSTFVFTLPVQAQGNANV